MLNANDLFRRMPGDIASEVLETLYAQDRPLYREIMGALANARRTRLVVIERMPRAERHPLALALLVQPSMIGVAFRALSSWLIYAHTSMLCSYLDALNIPHDGGGCVDEFPPEPSAEILQAAIEKLLSENPPARVAIYLHSFNALPDTRWAGLDRLLTEDSRLQLPD
jgi:hypothetical protein